MAELWLKYGLFGLIIIALAAVIKILHKESKEKDKGYREELEKITARHERAVIVSAEKQEKAIIVLAEKNERALSMVAEKNEKAIENITRRQEHAIEHLAEKQDEALKDMSETIDTRQKETNQILRDTGNILAGLKALLKDKE